MLLVWRFERHVLDFITQSGGTVERANYRDSVRIRMTGYLLWGDERTGRIFNSSCEVYGRRLYYPDFIFGFALSLWQPHADCLIWTLLQ